MKTHNIQIRSGAVKIIVCLAAFLIQLNTAQAQKSFATSKLTYATADINDGETKTITYYPTVVFESAFAKTDGPFAAYAQSWTEKYGKNDTVQSVVLNTRVINMRTLSYHKNHNFNCSVKGVSSVHDHEHELKVKEGKLGRKVDLHKIRINLGKDSHLIN